VQPPLKEHSTPEDVEETVRVFEKVTAEPTAAVCSKATEPVEINLRVGTVVEAGTQVVDH